MEERHDSSRNKKNMVQPPQELDDYGSDNDG